MSGSDNQGFADLGRRIDVLIFLALDQRLPSMTDKIEKLADVGLGSGEIARIVGKPSNYVTAVLSKGKNRKGGARGKNER